YDYDRAYMAWKKTLTDFQWDEYVAPFTYSALVFDHLDYRQLRWPGRGVNATSPYQFIEPGQRFDGKAVYEPMQAEDYDWFLDDPSDYMIRVHFPKLAGVLAPLGKLPPVHGVISWYQGMFEMLSAMGDPEVLAAFEALSRAAAEARKWFNSFLGFVGEMKDMGFPTFVLAVSHAPYDFLANFLRGTRGAMVDMYRSPDKLLKACEKITPWMVQAGVDGARATGLPVAAIFLHKGFEGMMSHEQFRTFYWPTLKKVLMGLIDEGVTPYVYTEGNYTARLETIRDVPRGKVVYHIEKDLFKAKEVLGNVACLTGGPPNSLLISGSTDDVKDYCRKLVDIVGKDGGFILDAEVPLIDENPQNVKVMTDFVMEYGVYR
ncbi:MAG: hypothetical protein IBX68_09690, partial [Dehalococcoidia bacterium]|nr:hypothetical protein [Dehalococcoidia bacterium]